MGGVSSGSFSATSEGFGLFQGATSLKNNGGFSSVHFSFTKKDISEYSKICIKLKGDGKKYQFRIKTHTKDDHSYIAAFVTSGKWENIEINLQDMYPGFRGKKLEEKNFSSDHIEQVTFLIGNKKEEKFKLLLDEIILK